MQPEKDARNGIFRKNPRRISAFLAFKKNLHIEFFVFPVYCKEKTHFPTCRSVKKRLKKTKVALSSTIGERRRQRPSFFLFFHAVFFPI